jgi:lipid-binding SYLF domain-containing protein
MRISTVMVAALALVPALGMAAGEKADKPSKKDEKVAERRKEIDDMAKATLDRLLAESAGAKTLYDKANGYAVFDNTKVAVLVGGGGGKGVAVDKTTGARTYMKMGTAGVGVGLGGQSYNVVFLFETREALDRFVEHGWQADTAATAAAGKEGATAEATFRDGVAYFQLTQAGLMAYADIAGTKYWKNPDLN